MHQVVSVAFSPDGSRIASGSYDNTIRICDVEIGQQIGNVLTGHKGSVECITFSPDGLRIASGSADQAIRIWDISESTLQPWPTVLTYNHQRHYTELYLSPNGPKSLILWIPHSFRDLNFMWFPSTMVISKARTVILRFDNVHWGPDWEKIKKWHVIAIFPQLIINLCSYKHRRHVVRQLWIMELIKVCTMRWQPCSNIYLHGHISWVLCHPSNMDNGLWCWCHQRPRTPATRSAVMSARSQQRRAALGGCTRGTRQRWVCKGAMGSKQTRRWLM